MRKLMLVAMTMLMLIVGGGGSALARPAASTPAPGSAEANAKAYADGINAPAVYFSERGDPIAYLTVTRVERGWEDYGDYYDPKAGTEYVAVTMKIEVVSRRNMILEPYTLSLIDSYGRNNSRSYAEPSEQSKLNVLTDDLAIASGETQEVTVIFEIYEDAQMGYLMWQPDSGVIVMVNLQDQNA